MNKHIIQAFYYVTHIQLYIQLKCEKRQRERKKINIVKVCHWNSVSFCVHFLDLIFEMRKGAAKNSLHFSFLEQHIDHSKCKKKLFNLILLLG